MWILDARVPSTRNPGQHLEYHAQFSKQHCEADQEGEWWACGVARPKPEDDLVLRNQFEILAEESEIQDSNLPDSASSVRVQESAAWEETRSGKPRPLRPSKQAKKYRKKEQKAQNQQAAGQEDSSKQKHWRELRQLLEQDGRQPMISQEEQLVSWAEKYESQIPEKTLGRWVIEHMLALLARGEDDAPAIKVAVEQILASPEEPTGMMELKLPQANITSYRTEIRRWVTEQPVRVTCLQETHIVPSKDQEVKASWNSLAKQISAIPAAVTQGEVKQGFNDGVCQPH